MCPPPFEATSIMYSRISWQSWGSLEGGSLLTSLGSFIVGNSTGLSITGFGPFANRIRLGSASAGASESLYCRDVLPYTRLTPPLNDEPRNLTEALGRA